MGTESTHWRTGKRGNTCSVSLPTQADLDLIEDEARLAALAIEKSQAETRLQLSATVFSHAREGIIITDARSVIVDVNDTFTSITGYSREETVGQKTRALLSSGRQSPEFYAARRQAIEAAGYWSGEVWNRRKNGEVFAELLTISAVHDAAGTLQNYVAMFTDITPMKEHQRQLEHIAHFDALTSLPNRVLLADQLQQALTQSQRRAGAGAGYRTGARSPAESGFGRGAAGPGLPAGFSQHRCHHLPTRRL